MYVPAGATCLNDTEKDIIPYFLYKRNYSFASVPMNIYLKIGKRIAIYKKHKNEDEDRVELTLQ